MPKAESKCQEQKKPEPEKEAVDQNLASELAQFFREKGITSDNIEKVDPIVSSAKKFIQEQIIQVRIDGLRDLVDSQLKTLEERGCPKPLREILQQKKEEAITKANQMDIPKGHLAVLAVIPRICWDLYGQMKTVVYKGNEGENHLLPNKVEDQEQVPTEPYFGFDIEDGESNKGKSSKNVKPTIDSQKRHPLTNDEVIALARHTDVLSRHNIWAVGSSYGSGWVPGLCLLVDRPDLCYGGVEYSVEHWGSPSCGSRE